MKENEEIIGICRKSRANQNIERQVRNILNKYKLLNHQDIIKDLNNEINTTTYLNNNILLDLFYYITPQRLPITFYKNHLFIIISIKDLILSFGKYNIGKRCTEAGGGLPRISFHLNPARL